jgi:hypothetical protein
MDTNRTPKSGRLPRDRFVLLLVVEAAVLEPLNSGAGDAASPCKVRFDERRDQGSIPMSKIVLSSWDDVQVRIGEVAHKTSSDRDRTQWVAVAPKQENRDLNSLQLRSQVRTEGGKPIGQLRILAPKLLTPIYRPQFCSIDSSRSRYQNQMCDEVLFTEGGFYCNHTSHRLSNQCRRAVYPRHYVVHQIFEAGNGGLCRYSSEAWIRDEDSLGWIWQREC